MNEARMILAQALEEPFTFRDLTGQLAERPLCEMNASEVLLAVRWQNEEAARLDREVEPHLSVVVAVNQGRANDYSAAERAKAAEAFGRYKEAEVKAARLTELIGAAMPDWPDGMILREAVRSCWPHVRQRHRASRG
jgi:hypothetical protein